MCLVPASSVKSQAKISTVIYSNKIKACATIDRDMFSPFRRMVEVFRERGATSEEKALTLKELGIPADFEAFSDLIPPDESPIVRVGSKYYLSEKRLAEFRKRRNEIFSPLGKWIKHTAKVPKGFLRYQVLHKLKECPMSGAELTSAIETELSGFWKPKPGSIYPLLKSLLRDGLTREVPDEDGRTRRYELTEKGAKFLETEVDRSRELREKIATGLVPFPPLFPTMMDQSERIPPSMHRLFQTLLSLRGAFESGPSPEILRELEKSTERYITELERIKRKAESSKSDD